MQLEHRGFVFQALESLLKHNPEKKVRIATGTNEIFYANEPFQSTQKPYVSASRVLEPMKPKLDLPDDVFIQGVLPYLSVKCVARCRSVSRRWNQLSFEKSSPELLNFCRPAIGHFLASRPPESIPPLLASCLTLILSYSSWTLPLSKAWSHDVQSLQELFLVFMVHPSGYRPILDLRQCRDLMYLHLSFPSSLDHCLEESFERVVLLPSHMLQQVRLDVNRFQDARWLMETKAFTRLHCKKIDLHFSIHSLPLGSSEVVTSFLSTMMQLTFPLCEHVRFIFRDEISSTPLLSRNFGADTLRHMLSDSSLRGMFSVSRTWKICLTHSLFKTNNATIRSLGRLRSNVFNLGGGFRSWTKCVQRKDPFFRMAPAPQTSFTHRFPFDDDTPLCKWSSKFLWPLDPRLKQLSFLFNAHNQICSKVQPEFLGSSQCHRSKGYIQDVRSTRRIPNFASMQHLPRHSLASQGISPCLIVRQPLVNPHLFTPHENVGLLRSNESFPRSAHTVLVGKPLTPSEQDLTRVSPRKYPTFLGKSLWSLPLSLHIAWAQSSLRWLSATLPPPSRNQDSLHCLQALDMHRLVSSSRGNSSHLQRLDLFLALDWSYDECAGFVSSLFAILGQGGLRSLQCLVLLGQQAPTQPPTREPCESSLPKELKRGGQAHLHSPPSSRHPPLEIFCTNLTFLHPSNFPSSRMSRLLLMPKHTQQASQFFSSVSPLADTFKTTLPRTTKSLFLSREARLVFDSVSFEEKDITTRSPHKRQRNQYSI